MVGPLKSVETPDPQTVKFVFEKPYAAFFGNLAQASLGFNSPTMLGVNYSPPYFHNGSAQTLEDVFAVHLVSGQTIQNLLGPGDQANLLAFLRSVDGRTNIFESAADRFKNPFKNM